MFLAPPPPPFCCSAPLSARLASRVERIHPRTANTRKTEIRDEANCFLSLCSSVQLTYDQECVDVHGGVGRGLHLLEYLQGGLVVGPELQHVAEMEGGLLEVPVRLQDLAELRISKCYFALSCPLLGKHLKI